MDRDQVDLFIDLIRQNHIENNDISDVHRFRIKLLQEHLDTDKEEELIEAIKYYNLNYGCFFTSAEINCSHISRCGDCDVIEFLKLFKNYYNKPYYSY